MMIMSIVEHASLVIRQKARVIMTTTTRRDPTRPNDNRNQQRPSQSNKKKHKLLNKTKVIKSNAKETPESTLQALTPQEKKSLSESFAMFFVLVSNLICT